MNLLGDFRAHEIVLVVLLAFMFAFIITMLQRRNKDRRSRFSWDDLLTDDGGKASSAKLVMFGAFVLTSWVILFQTLNKTLTDTTFGAYLAAWVAPLVTALMRRSPDYGKEARMRTEDDTDHPQPKDHQP